MRFTLRNLGRLEEATIDLSKDLIVLTGPNNTSKTYVAHAIYGFCEGLARAVLNVLWPLLNVERPNGHIDVDLAKLLQEHGRLILSQLGEHYRERLSDVLAADQGFTANARISFGLSEAEAAINQRTAALAFDQEVRRSEPLGEGQISFYRPQGSSVVTFTWTPPPTVKSKADILPVAVAYVAGWLVGALLPRINQPFVLTAERGAVQLFSRELSLKRTELVDTMLRMRHEGRLADPLALLDQSARRYPLAIREGLLIANDLAALKKGASPYAKLADGLEREIMQGVIKVSDDGEMTFHPEGVDVKLSMHLSSSSVKALSSLSFYLRHLAQEGDFLIIDEPELNLHPDNQRKVARLLARLARSGIKVMISTHSDYILRELNNLIMLSADKDGKLREKHGYAEEETLDPSLVAAYLFDGAHARLLPMEPKGIAVATIDEEIKDLNRSSRDIYFSLVDRDEA